MLSDLERDRLMHRDAQNPHTRSTNDTRIRKKLISWLSDMDDVIDILQYLPQSQIEDVITDDNIRGLMLIALSSTTIKKFSPIIGELGEPERWKAVEIIHPLTQNWKKSPIERPVEDQDIVRVFESIFDLSWLNRFTNVTTTAPLNGGNPIQKAISYANLYSSPELIQRLTEGERKGIERINEAIKKYGYAGLI
jgi:hypothetical protein